MRKRFSLAIYLISCIVTGTSAAVGLAYASYVYNRGYETPVEFNSGILANYFDGGNGTSTSPYLIETPDHLRNVQKLNVLGVFSENTYFKLSDDIPSSGMIWNGEDLLPIGSEDYPFYSQFNGNGKRINNLVVTGSQTNDIGMFGYVAMNSRIENFLLSSPTIIIKLAHILETYVVIEGVQELEQIKLLQSMEADCIQGYYYSEPLKPDDYIRFITDNKFEKGRRTGS